MAGSEVSAEVVSDDVSTDEVSAEDGAGCSDTPAPGADGIGAPEPGPPPAQEVSAMAAVRQAADAENRGKRINGKT
ncbi:hypothetical protein GCM10010470_03860 [Saccharopolyspora taberi]|uniref:Uncharacterized protein n=1 Tax=Saccharopolyspora taberi TaxID=60895 RepID=A0ABN3V1N4_9PSEU